MLPRILRAAVLVAAFFAATTANAVTVSPIKLELLPSQRATQLNIANPTNSIRIYDIRVEKWDSVDQTNARSITSELIGSPILLSRPVITLQPHSKATIRIAVAQRINPSADYYRIFIDDITPAGETTDADPDTANLRVSVSLPLEIRNAKDIKGNLTEVPGGLTNSGNNVLSIAGVKLIDGKVDSSVSRYIFPGQIWSTKLLPEQLVWLAGIQ